MINQKGERIKKFKDGKERPYFDLPYEEGERMTRYEGMWIKKESLEKLIAQKDALDAAGLSRADVSRINISKKYIIYAI